MSRKEVTPLQNIVKTAISELTKARTKTACNEIWGKKITELENCINLEGKTITLNTIRKAVSSIRKGIKAELNPKITTHKNRLNWLLHDQIKGLDGISTKQLGIVVCGREIAAKNNKDKQTSLMHKVSNRGKVSNYKPMIKEFERLLSSYDWMELTLSIAFLTGRRTIEVLKTGELKPLKGKYMRFNGQAKSKRKDSFIIPVLSSPAKIKKALSRLRSIKDFSSFTNEKINQKTQSALRGKLEKFVEGFTNQHTTVHDLRKIYTKICTETVLPENSIIKDSDGNVIRNERLFVKMILGHENTAIGLHYESWELV